MIIVITSIMKTEDRTSKYVGRNTKFKLHVNYFSHHICLVNLSFKIYFTHGLLWEGCPNPSYLHFPSSTLLWLILHLCPPLVLRGHTVSSLFTQLEGQVFSCLFSLCLTSHSGSRNSVKVGYINIKLYWS